STPSTTSPPSLHDALPIFKRSDQARFRELASSVIQSFPDSQSAAEAMFHLASASSKPERRALFEQIRAKYPADKFGYGATAMYRSEEHTSELQSRVDLVCR